MKPTVTVRNVIVSADLGRRLDLDAVVAIMDGAKYEPKKFPCVVVRLQEPKCAVLVFGTGKMICAGAPSAKRAAGAVLAVLGVMRERGIEVGANPETRVHNVVATVDLHGRINIEGAAVSLPRSVYEPGMFSGVIHRMVDPRAAVLLFASGKIVCVGAKSESEAHRAAHTIHSTLDGMGLVRYGAARPAAAPIAQPARSI